MCPETGQVFPLSKLLQAGHGFRCRLTTTHYIEYQRQVLALFVNRSNRPSSAEMPSSCDNLHFVDPASQEPLPVTASLIIEAVSRSSSFPK